MTGSQRNSEVIDITVLIADASGLKAPRTGGEFYLRQVLDYLQSRGISYRVVSLLEDLPRACVRNYFLANLVFIWKLLVHGEAAPIVLQDFHMHPWLFLFNWIAKLDRGRRLAAFVQLFHHNQQKNAFLNTVDRIVASLFLRPADLVFANSQTTARECERLGVSSDRIVVVYPGCDFADHTVRGKPSGNGSDPIRLMSVGNYEARKGLHVLIEAMALIHQVDPGVSQRLELRIAGDPYDDPAYARRLASMIEEAGLQENVHLLGWLDREQLKSNLAQSDIFVFPSLEEGFGMVLAEAMHYGLPIVASRAGAVPELVEEGVNGLLVEAGNAAELARAVIRLTTDRELRLALGRNSQAQSSRFVRPWTEVGQSFCQALAQLCTKAAD